MDDSQGRGYALLNSSKWRLRYNRRYVPKASSSKSTAPNGRHVESVSHRLTGSLSEEDEDEDSYLSRGHANDTPDRRPLTMPRSQKPTSPAAMTQSVGSSMFLDQPPVDRYNGVYIGLLLAGVGFLLPYNSFVSAVDYFQDRYQGSTIIFDMSFVYILVAFIAVLINNALVESVSLSMRINFGYLISLGTLTVVTICEVAWESFPTSLGYLLNLVGVAIVAFGCTIQQSSFYGYTSMLPARYTQAVMAGESAAGLIVSANRIVTKLLISDERANTLMFFSLSIFIILICVVIHNLLERTDFIQYYVRMCNNSSSMSTTTLTSLVGGASSISSEMTPDLRTRRPETRVKMDDSDFGLVELNGESDYLVRYASASRIIMATAWD
ncbi:Equilibrative nucleoside transporter 4 [Halotydeus destructor]|nr:Equilibrative nucleoside transporter 4 [Halotydeus destructor]